MSAGFSRAVCGYARMRQGARGRVRPQKGNIVNTRTIALIALIIAVIVLLLLVL
jgi:hypothetical protein